jgi:hypothetical protein
MKTRVYLKAFALIMTASIMLLFLACAGATTVVQTQPFTITSTVTQPGSTIIQTQTAITTVTINQPTITIPATVSPLVIIIGGGYADKTVSLAPNQQFRWVNDDHEAHSVTSVDGLFDTTLQPGESFDYQIYYPGVYNYYCKLHAGESAALIVGQ